MTGDASLELYCVAGDFASMLRLRDIMLSEGEDVGPLEKEIARYFTHEVTREKIDTVIGALRHAETMAAVAKAEKDRLKKLEASWTTQAEWLKETVRNVLNMSGKKRLDGKTAGYLLLATNGGKQEVVITQESLLPEDLVQYEGRISGQAMGWLRSALGPHITDNERSRWEYWSGREDVQMTRVPHKGRIAEALSAKCSKCNGNGVVEDQVFEDSLIQGELPCSACDGDGKARVPGAHFAPRSSHVEIT